MPGDHEDVEARVADPPVSPLALSLVIPAYNEGARLEDGVARLRDAAAVGALALGGTEFVVVDDGSTDATVARAAELFAPFPHVRIVRLPRNRGKGAAVRAGVGVATAPVIAFADADMAIDPSQTPLFLRALEGADVAIGSRAASGASVNRSSIRRSVTNRAFNQLVNVLTRLSLDDTQCGFKAFRAPAAKLLFHCSTTDRFAFDVEILALARRLGMPIAQVPVRWLRVKGSRVRLWADAVPMARDVIRASRGLQRMPTVPALGMPPGGGWAGGSDGLRSFESLLVDLSTHLPVVRQTDGEIRVLCPLMANPEVDAMAERVGALTRAGTVTRVVVSAPELSALAPLSLTWADDAVAPTLT
jgi:hypothetical protein